MATISPCSLATTSVGTADGATTEYHDGASTPRTFSSVSVGTSGARGERFGLVTASATTRLARTYDIRVVTPAKMTCASPDRTPIAAGPDPLYWMATISVPVAALNSSGTRCVGVQMLPEA